MSTPLDLRKLEKKTFRTIYEDGLLDIDIAGVVASMALMAFLPEEDAGRWLRYGLFFGGMIASTLIYQLGKKFITGPRLGQVVFGPARKRRGATLAAILGVIIVIQALVVLGSVVFWNNPGLAQRLGLAVSQPQQGKLLVAVIGALFVGPSMTLMAYFNDFPRGYYIAVLLSLGVFLLIWFRSPLMMLAAAVLIFIPGVVLFIRFLRKYPLPIDKAPHGE
ncbi:hypothetical protein LARV_00807 [Longilinea arvoryzae]|uniref:Uncharacterized protein n=1 Tax=Longilinea arvoryzae TaxID=360412 RepID=A0A0S7BCU0_9CHLR|nr:hypothetical protein [Longilinea arvoryzae]GAP13065.1 hypothetical protein LARV_00807 [Longilinea arvoryzae]